MGKHYTTNEIKTIRELAETMTAPQVAKKIKRTAQSVYGVAHRHGIIFSVGHDKRFTKEQVSEVVRLRNQGLMFKEVARATGLEPNSCANLYRLHA